MFRFARKRSVSGFAHAQMRARQIEKCVLTEGLYFGSIASISVVYSGMLVPIKKTSVGLHRWTSQTLGFIN